MTMKRIHGRLASMAIAAAALLLASTAASAATYNLRYSDIGPPRGPRAAALMWWADELAKRSNGEVKVEFFWSQSLVKGKETLKAVGSGLAEAGSILGIYTPADLPIWNLANAPFGPGDPWVGMHTWYELRKVLPELREETASKNVLILSNFTTGPVDILSRKPIRSAADVAGMKVRTTGGWTQLMEALGATTVNIGFGELYQALDRGTVDATINYIPFVKSYKHFEVAGHVTEVQMGQVLGYGPGINLKLFDGMPADIKKVLTETSYELMDVYAEKYLADVDQTRAELTKGIDGKKVVFHELPADEIDRWKSKASAFTEVWLKQMADRGTDATRIVAKYEEVRARYESELKDKGYPWKR
jgi:TRAP-type C4-dicarboxylate transport system substrate-binding protein